MRVREKGEDIRACMSRPCRILLGLLHSVARSIKSWQIPVLAPTRESRLLAKTEGREGGSTCG